DAGQAGDIHYFAMEYLEGTDLESLVELAGPLPIDQACDYVRQAAAGLQHALERGLVHRDIKPANLVVIPPAGRSKQEAAVNPAAYPKEGKVKILDMGLVRFDTPDDASDSANLTVAGAMVGTPNFIAPEQILDPHHADIRADLYSLGCAFYFLLTGKVPFP